MHQQVGLADFFQSRPKGCHQSGWQFLDETDGVGQQDSLPTGQFQLAGGRVQRGKELVSHIDISSRELIEQCGFKGVREGNVGVHKNQALVLIAYDGANAGELLCLAQKIKRSVKDRFDVDIEPEVNII